MQPSGVRLRALAEESTLKGVVGAPLTVFGNASDGQGGVLNGASSERHPRRKRWAGYLRWRHVRAPINYAYGNSPGHYVHKIELENTI
jgi:hypothetical protein